MSSQHYQLPFMQRLKYWSSRPANRHLFTGLLLVALILSGLVTAMQLSKRQVDTRTGATTDRIDITLSPQDLSPAPIETFTIDAYAHPNQHSFAATELHLSYNPQIIQLDQTAVGPGLKLLHSATQSGQLVLSIGIQCYPDDTCFTPTQEAVRLVTLNFTAIAPGQTQINLTPDTKTAARVAFPTDITGDLTDTSVTVIAPTSPTPTPDPNLTPYPTQPIEEPTPTPTSGPIPSPAPATGIIYGTVSSAANGQPVPQATVTLRIPGTKGKPSVITSITTDSTGHYLLSHNPGSYDIEYTAKGFGSYQTSITLRADQSLRKDVLLDPNSENDKSKSLFNRTLDLLQSGATDLSN
jgi:hypothetical protein